MSMSAINGPLIGLFSLAYAMGHPDVSPYRPALVDKTLASFHEDINRTSKELNEGLKRIANAQAAMASFTAPAAEPQPMQPALRSTSPANSTAPAQRDGSFAPISGPKTVLPGVDRQISGAGFTPLQAR